MLMCTMRPTPARLAASNRTFELAIACIKVKCGGLSNRTQYVFIRTSMPRSELRAVARAGVARCTGRTMILIAFRNGLRAAELCDLRWDE
jgi:integrase